MLTSVHLLTLKLKTLHERQQQTILKLTHNRQLTILPAFLLPILLHLALTLHSLPLALDGAIADALKTGVLLNRSS